MTIESEDMTFSPQRATQLLDNFHSVLSRVAAVNKSSRPVRVVLVSKIKPASDVLALHSTSTSPRPIHFGENYVQELTDKAASLPRSIKWHFIGGLQSNKCKALAGIPNLWCVSSVDTVKKADLLEKGRVHVVKSDGDKARLRIMVQVNTSGEESKSGVEPGDAVALCRHVKEQCPSLRLAGLMTIGAIARSKATTAETGNEDFTKLVEVRDAVAQELDMPTDDLELSMGMSSDYEGAITHGSNEVRIGTTIFGERPSKRNSGPSGQDTS